MCRFRSSRWRHQGSRAFQIQLLVDIFCRYITRGAPADELAPCFLSFPTSTHSPSTILSELERACDTRIVTAFCLWGFLKEEMNTWIQAITSAISSDKIEVSPTTQSTPASSRAQTLPASVTITSESSPGKREKDKEKDKEKRFSLFGKKK